MAKERKKTEVFTSEIPFYHYVTGLSENPRSMLRVTQLDLSSRASYPSKEELDKIAREDRVYPLNELDILRLQYREDALGRAYGLPGGIADPSGLSVEIMKESLSGIVNTVLYSNERGKTQVSFQREKSLEAERVTIRLGLFFHGASQPNPPLEEGKIYEPLSPDSRVNTLYTEENLFVTGKNCQVEKGQGQTYHIHNGPPGASQIGQGIYRELCCAACGLDAVDSRNQAEVNVRNLQEFIASQPWKDLGIDIKLDVYEALSHLESPEPSLFRVYDTTANAPSFAKQAGDDWRSGDISCLNGLGNVLSAEDILLRMRRSMDSHEWIRVIGCVDRRNWPSIASDNRVRMVASAQGKVVGEDTTTIGGLDHTEITAVVNGNEKTASVMYALLTNPPVISRFVGNYARPDFQEAGVLYYSLPEQMWEAWEIQNALVEGTGRLLSVLNMLWRRVSLTQHQPDVFMHSLQGGIQKVAYTGLSGLPMIVPEGLREIMRRVKQGVLNPIVSQEEVRSGAESRQFGPRRIDRPNHPRFTRNAQSVPIGVNGIITSEVRERPEIGRGGTLPFTVKPATIVVM